MRIHKLAIVGILMALMLVIAACETDDDDADEPGVTDDTTEDVTPAPEDDDAMTPEVDDEETPEVTPDATPEDDEMTPEATPEDDATPEAGVGVTDDRLMVDVTLTEMDIELDHQENGATNDEATPEATPGDDDAVTDDETPEATPEDDDNGITGDTDTDLFNGVTLPSGTITLQITNDGDMEHSLAIERTDDNGILDDDDGVLDDDDATPTTDDEATPTTDDEATPTTDDDDATPTTGNGEALYELDETLQPGDSTEWEIELEPGTYIFYCPVGDHRDQGMEIEVTIEEDNDDDNGGVLDDDDDATPEADATPEVDATPEDDDES